MSDPSDTDSTPPRPSLLRERLRTEREARERAMTARERVSRALALGRSLRALRRRVTGGG